MNYDVNSVTQDIRSALGFPPDLNFREVKTPFFRGNFLFFDGLIDVMELENTFIKPLLCLDSPVDEDPYGIKGVVYYSGNIKEITPQEGKNSVLSGCAVMICPFSVIEIPVKKFAERSVEEPPTFSVIKGPREGFTENVKTNCALIRRRIKSADLVFDEISVGVQTKTKVIVAYLKGVAGDEIATAVKEKLASYEIDGIVDSSYLSKMLEERPYSLFKQVGNSEKPDIIVNKLLDGKTAIICDGSPIVLYLPFALIEDFEDVQDSYKRPLRASLLRYIRFIAVFLALLSPALFVAIQVYQFEILPIELLVTVINSTGHIPFSPILEMLIALILFEIIGEASIRMPRHVSMALGVVGAIVLGETAVAAGLLSSLTVLIVAMSGIGLYAVPDEVGTIGTLRILFVICGGLLGLPGLIFVGMSVIAYMSCLSSYDVPYLMPLAPIVKEDIKDLLVKHNLTDLKYRSGAFRLKNKVKIRKVK